MKGSSHRVLLGIVLSAILWSSGCASATAPKASPVSTVAAPLPAAPASVTAPFAPACTDASGSLAISKPVIYLYPVRPTSVNVRLAVDGKITYTDPPIDSGQSWNVLAYPSGTLISQSSGRQYPYLFWEADAATAFDMSTGFVVPGRETRRFLAGRLETLGLSRAEADAFIDYWAPRMEPNTYNLVHFEGPAYERMARLFVAPKPDAQIRVFMVFQPLADAIDVTPQELVRPAPRRGFVLVEWGGTELPRR